MLPYVLLFIATFIAYFVKGITGFGNTLVMGSLFSLMTVPNKVTTPTDLIFSIPTNLYMAFRERKDISLKVVIPLSLMMVVGIIPGTFILEMGSDWLLKFILGIVVIGVGLEMLTRKASIVYVKQNPVFLVMIGVISGVMAGLYGIGALLVAYINRTTSNRSQFRANICCVFLVENVCRITIYAIRGILNKEILLLVLLLSPAVILGLLLGIKVDSKMREDVVKKLIIALLIISGIMLCFKSIFFH